MSNIISQIGRVTSPGEQRLLSSESETMDYSGLNELYKLAYKDRVDELNKIGVKSTFAGFIALIGGSTKKAGLKAMFEKMGNVATLAGAAVLFTGISYTNEVQSAFELAMEHAGVNSTSVTVVKEIWRVDMGTRIVYDEVIKFEK